MVDLRAMLFASIVLSAANVLAQGGGSTNQTITVSTSSGTGTTNAEFIWLEETIGPGETFVGDRGNCDFGPPFPQCNLLGGEGTVADPYSFRCDPPPAVSNCTAGTLFTVLAGTSNLNSHIHTQIAQTTPPVSAPVPLGPWGPVGSAFGIGLLALARSYLQSRRRQTGGEGS